METDLIQNIEETIHLRPSQKAILKVIRTSINNGEIESAVELTKKLGNGLKENDKNIFHESISTIDSIRPYLLKSKIITKKQSVNAEKAAKQKAITTPSQKETVEETQALLAEKTRPKQVESMGQQPTEIIEEIETVEIEEKQLAAPSAEDIQKIEQKQEQQIDVDGEVVQLGSDSKRPEAKDRRRKPRDESNIQIDDFSSLKDGELPPSAEKTPTDFDKAEKTGKLPETKSKYQPEEEQIPENFNSSDGNYNSLGVNLVPEEIDGKPPGLPDKDRRRPSLGQGHQFKYSDNFVPPTELDEEHKQDKEKHKTKQSEEQKQLPEIPYQMEPPAYGGETPYSPYGGGYPVYIPEPTASIQDELEKTEQNFPLSEENKFKSEKKPEIMPDNFSAPNSSFSGMPGGFPGQLMPVPFPAVPGDYSIPTEMGMQGIEGFPYDMSGIQGTYDKLSDLIDEIRKQVQQFPGMSSQQPSMPSIGGGGSAGGGGMPSIAPPPVQPIIQQSGGTSGSSGSSGNIDSSQNIEQQLPDFTEVTEDDISNIIGGQQEPVLMIDAQNSGQGLSFTGEEIPELRVSEKNIKDPEIQPVIQAQQIASKGGITQTPGAADTLSNVSTPGSQPFEYAPIPGMEPPPAEQQQLQEQQAGQALPPAMDSGLSQALTQALSGLLTEAVENFKDENKDLYDSVEKQLKPEAETLKMPEFEEEEDDGTPWMRDAKETEFKVHSFDDKDESIGQYDPYADLQDEDEKSPDPFKDVNKNLFDEVEREEKTVKDQISGAYKDDDGIKVEAKTTETGGREFVFTNLDAAKKKRKPPKKMPKRVRLSYSFRNLFNNKTYIRYKEILNRAAILVAERRLDDALDYYYTIRDQNIPNVFRMMIQQNIDDIEDTIMRTFQFSDTIVKVKDSGRAIRLKDINEYERQLIEEEKQRIASRQEEVLYSEDE